MTTDQVQALVEVERLLAGALMGHGQATDAPHAFSRGEVADLEAAQHILRDVVDQLDTGLDRILDRIHVSLNQPIA